MGVFFEILIFHFLTFHFFVAVRYVWDGSEGPKAIIILLDHIETIELCFPFIILGKLIAFGCPNDSSDLYPKIQFFLFFFSFPEIPL